jgi:2-methylcitrate dehydratase PrpD
MTFGADPAMRMLFEPFAQKAAPAMAIDAKFSLPFTVASALVHGKVDLPSYAPEALADPGVLALAARSRFLDEAGSMTRGTLELELADGRVLSRTVEHPKGHPSNPMSDEALAAKFQECARWAARPVVKARLDHFVDEVSRLERLGDVSRLVAGL